MLPSVIDIDSPAARRIWLRAQRLDSRDPFGAGPQATQAAIEHLGYVQIDTINVIERSHHHILFTRIPGYRRADLHRAQTIDKSVFEYWTHALAYVPTRDFAIFARAMKGHRADPTHWYADADPKALARLKRQIVKDGALSIRDITDDDPVEKTHAWASRKPSKRVLELGFYNGTFVVSERVGMLKTYEILERHFGWSKWPKAATDRQIAEYKLDRALRSQGVISGPSVMHPWQRFSPDIAAIIESRLRRKTLRAVSIGGQLHYANPETLDTVPVAGEPLVHILSPFDPLVIQRQRLKQFFGHEHVFEAYVPKAKRQFGYFTLPVLIGEKVVALLDLKTDRAAGKLLIQAWHWLDDGRPKAHKRMIEEELTRFERFQLGD